MDRRTWLQLMAMLSAARAASPQARGGRGGGGQQAPMRVTREQIVGALALMGLQFQDGEIDMMLNSANRGLASYENLRKIDVPYGTEPAFSFLPGLPDRTPVKGPAVFAPTIAKSKSKARPPANL